MRSKISAYPRSQSSTSPKTKTPIFEDKQFLAELKRNGWTPEQKFTLKPDPTRHEAATKFLERFAGISIRRTNLDGLLGKIPGSCKSFVDWFDFDYERAGEGYHPEVTKIFEKGLGNPLYVIGECDCAHTVILMDDKGRFYRDCDTVLHPVALDIEQLFHNLWNGPYYDETGLENIKSVARKLLEDEV